MNIFLCDAWTKVRTQELTPRRVLIPAARGLALDGAGGEVVSFQVVVAAGSSPLRDVTVRAEPLRGERQPPLDPSLFECLRVGFVRAPAVAYTGGLPAGWWPDPLFPFQPFPVSAGELQPIWINLKLPRDRGGSFRGYLIVEAAGQASVRIPLRVRIRRFNLPERHTLHNLFDFGVSDRFSGFLQRYGPLDGRGFAPFARFLRYLSEHTVNGLLYNHPLIGSGLLRVGEKRGRFSADLSRAEPLFALLRQLGMEFNAWPAPVWPTADLYLSFYTCVERFRRNGQAMYRHPDFNRFLLELAADIQRQLARRRLAKHSFAYLYDEPHKPWQGLQMDALARGFQALQPRVRRLAAIGSPAMVQEVLKKDMPIDIVVGHVSFYDPETHKNILSSGREFWWYTSNWPSSHLSFWVDEPAIHHRLLYWLTWRHGVPGFGYWNTSVWNYRAYGYDNIARNRRMNWPYADWNITPSGRWGSGSGDAQLVYPGEDGPIGSIRCECIRHGFQDHACLSLLERARETRAPARARGADALLTKIKTRLGTVKRCTRSPTVLTALRQAVNDRLEAR